uniref:NADH dehydrogenase subunit 6 n=1 Tax=Blasticotoma filiceti TaxID=1141352 RepID=UPI00220AB45F|nr:NADH dehydrogenase subunit 6 [Blasticotoma filiceti]UXW93448.1 NADH dehydrogenase subunit 6 [Blasticotoma filiceti]
MTMMMIWISINLTIMFCFMKHPLSMGLNLMMQTTIVSIITSMHSNTSWFSYILFLIMVGSMLILFLYIISISSNEKFTPIPSNIMLIPISLMLMSLLLMKLNSQDFMLLTSKMHPKEILQMINYEFNTNLNFMSLNKLYNTPTNMMIILMMFYLLFTLIIIVKIIKINQSSPLRKKT